MTIVSSTTRELRSATYTQDFRFLQLKEMSSCNIQIVTQTSIDLSTSKNYQLVKAKVNRMGGEYSGGKDKAAAYVDISHGS